MRKHKLTTLLFTVLLCVGVPSYAEPVGDWTYDCTNSECVLTQSAKDGPLKITVSKREKGMFALIAVPLGVNLPFGLQTRVDGGAAARLTFATCTIGGCFSAIPLHGTTLTSWRRGLVLSVSYQDGAGQAQTSTVSLRGMIDGLARLGS